MPGTGTEKFAPALIDVQDLADKLGKKYGGWTPLAKNFSEVKGRFQSIPDYFIDFPGLYRKISGPRSACRTVRTPGTSCESAAPS
jgi:hypothetical protein